MGLLVRLMAQPTNIAATVDLMRHVWQCRDEGEATIDLSAVPMRQAALNSGSDMAHAHVRCFFMMRWRKL